MKQTVICIFLLFILIFTNISIISASNVKTEVNSEDAKDIKVLDSGTNCALFVTGAGTKDWPNSDDIFERVGTNARNMFNSYGYKTWLEIQPSRQSLKDVIEKQIPENLTNGNQIFIYLAAHGDITGTLLIKKILGIASFVLSPITLSNWLENMENNLVSQGKFYSYCTIVIESCFAGNHMRYLSKENRIIITSTDSSHSAYGSKAGEMYFSDAFFEALSNGKTYGIAWEKADRRIDTDINISSQDPRLEDTGNHESVGTDYPDTLPLYDGDPVHPFEKDGQIAKDLKTHTSSKSSVYKKPIIIKYEIFKLLFPKLYEPRPLDYS